MPGMQEEAAEKIDAGLRKALAGNSRRRDRLYLAVRLGLSVEGHLRLGAVDGLACDQAVADLEDGEPCGLARL